MNCCRNCRLVVDENEDDFDVGDKLKKITMYSLNNFIKICLLKLLAVKKQVCFNGVK